MTTAQVMLHQLKQPTDASREEQPLCCLESSTATIRTQEERLRASILRYATNDKIKLSTGYGNLPRRSTRGPLDIGDSPLAADPLSVQPPSLPQQSSSLLSPSVSQYATPQPRSPRLPSPNPGSKLSNLSTVPSFRTAQTTRSPVPSPTRASSSLAKDFSFLLRPEIYHPLTHLDIPPPFRTFTNQPTSSTPLESLVSQGRFRSAAIKAAQLLTSPTISPADHVQIFSLIYTRLSSLTLCNQTQLAAQEVKALEDLNSSYYRDEENDTHLVLWELRVLAVRLQGMGFNDARRGVMGYYDLAKAARLTLTALKKANAIQVTESGVVNTSKDDSIPMRTEIALWEDRLSDLGIRVASALVEMEDLEGATRFLTTLQPSSSLSPSLQMQKALLWLCVGDVEAARLSISTAASTTTEHRKLILALAHMADADYQTAVLVWEELISSSPSPSGEKAMYEQNLAVCFLYLGRMAEARALLTELINAQNSFHALTFNLSTIYELCTERSRALKIGLAEKIAGFLEDGNVGEGHAVAGWEKVNGDFKL